MNLGSWIVLAIVVVIVGLAIKATFFKKKPRGGCCDTGDAPACCKASATDPTTCGVEPGSSACAGCDGCAAARFALEPTIRELR
jgi:hypothetical protein